MKKFMWIAALLAVLALVIAGCPGPKTGDDDGDGDGDGDLTPTNIHFAKDGGDDGYIKIQDGNVPLIISAEDPYVRVMFDPPGEDFDNFRIKFTLSQATNVAINGGFHIVDGKVTYIYGYEYIDNTANVTFEKDPSPLFSGIVKENMVGICFPFADDGSDAGITFTIDEIAFVGASDSGGDDGDENNWTGEVVEAGNWFLSASENGTAAEGNAVTGSGTGDDAWYVYAYFNEAADDVKLTFTTTGEITLIKQCVYDDTGTWGWGWGAVTSGTNWGLSGASSWEASGTTLNKNALKGICIKIEGSGTFTLTMVELVK